MVGETAGQATGGAGLRLGRSCPDESAHRVDIVAPGGAVTVLALACPSCEPGSRTDEFAAMLTARRWTLAGVGRLPAATRAGLAAAGILDQLYQGTVTEIREAAERCGDRYGVEPPAAVTADPATADPVGAAAVLDAATGWVRALRDAR